MANPQEGKTKRKILKLLQKNKEMTYTQIKNQLGITDAAVSKHLVELVNEKTIEFEKKGREKHYRIGEKASELFENQVALFSEAFTGYLSDMDPKEYTFEELIPAVIDSVGPFFIYLILKSIKTGKDWFSAFDPDEIFRASTDFIIHGLYDKKEDLEELRILLGRTDLETFADRANQLAKNRKNAPLIKDLYELLEERYGSLIEMLEDFHEYAFKERDF